VGIKSASLNPIVVMAGLEVDKKNEEMRHILEGPSMRGSRTCILQGERNAKVENQSAGGGEF